MERAIGQDRGFDTLVQRDGLARTSQRAGRVVLGVAVGLTALGLIVLYSSSSVAELVRGTRFGADSPLARQLRWVFLGFLAGWAVSVVRLSWLRRMAVPAFAVTILLLLLVLLAGHEVKGARRWLRPLGLSIQPSEFLKIAVLLYLADRLAAREGDAAFGDRSRIALLLAPVGLATLLVLVEPDLGTSLFIIAEAVVLLALAGVRPTRVLPFVLTALPLLLFYAYTRFAHVRERLAGTGVQVREALVAIGSGGLTGTGLGQGAHKLGYVPEAHSDFIFAIIGEELGFLGCAGVVVAFMALAWYGSRLAWNARAVGPHAYYVASACVFLITFQALINVAVVTDVAPTKGICLPFISAGGSNFVVVAIAVGLLVNISRRTVEEVGEDPWA